MTQENKRLLSIVLAACIAVAGGTALAGDAKGKLGYGFEPGLQSGRDYVAGQLIIGFRDGAWISAKASVAVAAKRAGGSVSEEIPGEALLMSFGSDDAAAAAAEALAALPGVAFVERNGFMRIPPKPVIPVAKAGAASAGGPDIAPMAVSGDRGVGYQWHLSVIGKTRPLPALVASPPTVAVIDTGVDYTHPDLDENKVIRGPNTVANTMDPADDNGHGTHVAGIIAAQGGNGFYGEGVCQNCKILAVKVLGQDGSGSFFDIAQGMSYVVANRASCCEPDVRVVNMSLGGPASSLIQAQVLAMRNAGLALAAAAGNDNTTSTTSAQPGADPNAAFRVMSTEENDARSWFSNFSPATAPSQFNIAAPGTNIFSTLPVESYGALSGTSMASPVVAGVAAVVWGQFPTLTRDQLVTRLVSTGKVVSKGFAAPARRVNLRNALANSPVADFGLIGRILDPFNGFPHTPVTISSIARLYSGTTQLATDATDRGGMYDFVLSTTMAGTGRLLRADRVADSPTPSLPTTTLRTGVSVTTGVVTGPFTDAMPRARPAGNASITVDWNTTQPIEDTTGCLDACQGWDFDLYVKTPSAAYIGFGNNGDLLTSPFAIWPRDSVDDLQPLETAVIGSAAPNGIYRVIVDKWPSTTGTVFNPSWTGSGASVQVFNGPTLLATVVPPPTCATTRYWHVGTLNKTGATTYTWAPVNTCVAVIP